MNLKRFSCLSVLALSAIIFIVFITIFFFVLGKAIFGKEPTSPNMEHGTRSIEHLIQNSSSTYMLCDPCYVIQDPRFVLYIPSINLNHQIVENVDPTKKDNYLPIIEHDIAHGKFTFTPDEVYARQNGITYLFSHKASDTSLFNNLDKVGIGEILYVKYKDNVYSYSIVSKTFVDSKDTISYTSKSSTPLLRLQTCAEGTSKRLIVDARLEGIV